MLLQFRDANVDFQGKAKTQNILPGIIKVLSGGTAGHLLIRLLMIRSPAPVYVPNMLGQDTNPKLLV